MNKCLSFLKQRPRVAKFKTRQIALHVIVSCHKEVLRRTLLISSKVNKTEHKYGKVRRKFRYIFQPLNESMVPWVSILDTQRQVSCTTIK